MKSRWLAVSIEDALAGLPGISIVSGAATTHRVSQRVDIKSSRNELERDLTKAAVVAIATLGTFLAVTSRTAEVWVPIEPAEVAEISRRRSNVMRGIVVSIGVFFLTFGVFWYLLQDMEAGSALPSIVGLTGAGIAASTAIAALAVGRPRYAMFSVDGKRLVILGHADFIRATKELVEERSRARAHGGLSAE